MTRQAKIDALVESIYSAIPVSFTANERVALHTAICNALVSAHGIGYEEAQKEEVAERTEFVRANVGRIYAELRREEHASALNHHADEGKWANDEALFRKAWDIANQLWDAHK